MDPPSRQWPLYAQSMKHGLTGTRLNGERPMTGPSALTAGVSAMLPGIARAAGFLPPKRHGTTVPQTLRRTALLLVTSNAMPTMPLINLHDLAVPRRPSADSPALRSPAALPRRQTTDDPTRKTSECSSQR